MIHALTSQRRDWLFVVFISLSRFGNKNKMATLLPSFYIPYVIVGSRPMPTHNISLTPEQDAFIDEVLATGEYRNASKAVRDAIRALQHRRTEEALKLDRLRLAIRAGVAALDRGAHTEIEDENLDSFVDDLAATNDCD